MNIGTYGQLSLAEARRIAKELKARVALGHDVAAEKQDRKADAVAKIEAKNNAYTVGQLADDYFNSRVLGKWKHPNIVRARIENDIKPNIGKLAIEDVKPSHIDLMLKAIIKRGAPTMANDVLHWTRRRVTTPSSETYCNTTLHQLLTWRTLAAKKQPETAH